MLLLCGWFGRILQRLFSDNGGYASKLCMFPSEEYVAEGKALVEVRQKSKACCQMAPGNAGIR